MSILDQGDIFRKVVEALPVGVWITDSAGRLVYGNPAGRQLWSGSSASALSQSSGSQGWFLSGGKRLTVEEWIAARALRDGRAAIDEEIEIECPDGTHRIALTSALPIADGQGVISGAVMLHHDITERKQAEAQLRGVTDRDPLTGAYNRSVLYETLESEVLRVRRYGGGLAVIMFDIDQFKEINDDHGHLAGDRVLTAIAELVRGALRGFDRLCRYSGEEFLIIAPGTDLRQAARLAERLRVQIASASFDTVSRVTCSFGVCEYGGEEDADALVRRAEDLMYQARRAGRSSTAVQ
jgi:diguanylate cyclase (GGDEF)-like protein/PAS domain S-box-containing protein